MLSPSDFNNAVPQFTNGNYASNPINPQYVAEPDAENYNRGTEPLQTLPAQWWNWFINKFTARFNKVNIYVKNIFNELAQVLSIFNITPDGTEQTPTTSQLKTVFECCYPQYVKNDLYGNIAGTALGTAAVGTATTFARSDHVHPITNIFTGLKYCGYYGFEINGQNGGDPVDRYYDFFRTPSQGLIPYCNDVVNGQSCIGTPDWPFREMHAKTFVGNLSGTASNASYLYGASDTVNCALCAKVELGNTFNMYTAYPWVAFNFAGGASCVKFERGDSSGCLGDVALRCLTTTGAVIVQATELDTSNFNQGLTILYGDSGYSSFTIGGNGAVGAHCAFWFGTNCATPSRLNLTYNGNECAGTYFCGEQNGAVSWYGDVHGNLYGLATRAASADCALTACSADTAAIANKVRDSRASELDVSLTFQSPYPININDVDFVAVSLSKCECKNLIGFMDRQYLAVGCATNDSDGNAINTTYAKKASFCFYPDTGTLNINM